MDVYSHILTPWIFLSISELNQSISFINAELMCLYKKKFNADILRVLYFVS